MSRLSVTSLPPQIHPSYRGSQWGTALPWHLPLAPGTGDCHNSYQCHFFLSCNPEKKKIFFIKKKKTFRELNFAPAVSTLILSFCHLCCRESSGESQWLSSTRREASCTGRMSASWLWVSSLPSGITISTFLQLTGTRDTKHRVLPHDCFLIHVAESLHTLTICYDTFHCLKGSLVCEASVKNI